MFAISVEKAVPLGEGEADGEKTLFVELADQCGLARRYTASLTLDTAAPSDGRVEVEGIPGLDGRKYTGDTGGLVTVRLGAADALSGVEGYRLTVDADPAGGDFEGIPATGEVVVPIGTTAGLHTVHVEYRDNAGNVSGAATAEIVLDLEPPAGTVSLVDPGDWVVGTVVDIVLEASDGADGSGVSEMMLSNDAAFAGAEWEPFVKGRRWTLLEGDDGPRTVYARFRDPVGHVSDAASGTTALVTKGGIKGKVTLSGQGDHSGTTVTVADQSPPLTMTMLEVDFIVETLGKAIRRATDELVREGAL